MSKNSANNKSIEYVTIYIDAAPYQVSAENNLLAAVLSHKLDLPYFCWHPSMGSIGACRQCAVTQYQDENDSRGRVVMSCMTPVVDGMRIGLTDKTSSQFRKQVIAAMMTNHPHDCPVCAEGGECHLQDMTVMTGHHVRSYCGEKRTFNNQYLGELLGHEMNRCITCYRCVRFYKDYAGGNDLDVMGSGNQVYFGRQRDGDLQSEFAGNLIEVCPTGVFTNKVFSAHYTRKWDLQSAPSVCAHCSVGCNTSISERYGSVRRVMNRYNHDINGYFLCDRGRFGLGFVNAANRLRLIKGIDIKTGDVVKSDLTELNLAEALCHHRRENFIGIGSARASFEVNRLLKCLVGAENFSLGYSNNEMQLAVRHKQLLAQYPQPSLADIEMRSLGQQSIDKQHKEQLSCTELAHDLVIIIGENITKSAPRLSLSVRQTLRHATLEKADDIGVMHWQDNAVRNHGGLEKTPLFTLQVQTTSLDNDAKQALVLHPREIIEAIDQLIDFLEDNLTDIHQKSNKLKKQPLPSELVNLAVAIRKARKPLIITGDSLKSPQLLASVDNFMACLTRHALTPGAELIVVAKQCNSVGVLQLVSEHTLSIEQILDRATHQKNTSLLVVEQDLAHLSTKQMQQLRSRCKTIIVLDHSDSVITDIADIVFPVACISESAGHLVNYQGDLQAFYPVHLAQKPIFASWRWLAMLAKILFEQNMLNFATIQSLQQYFVSLGEAWAVQVIKEYVSNNHHNKRDVAQQTHRASGRTAMRASISVHEPKALKDQANYINFSMEGAGLVSVSAMPYTWAPGWNSNQSIFQYQQQINGGLHQQAPENRMVFVVDEQLEFLCEKTWPVSLIATRTKQGPPLQSTNQLTFIQNIPWFLYDEQARRIPEFVMRYSGNKIEITQELAKEKGWQEQQVIKLKVNDVFIMAEIVINNQIPSHIIQGCIFELPASVNNCSIELSQITKATEQDTLSFYQQQKTRFEQAKNEKEFILAHLKKQDQQCAISFVEQDINDE